MSRIPKRERLMNLVAVLLAAQRPLSFREIQGSVVGYDDPAGEEALQKRFDRDKSELRELGIPVEYRAGGEEPGGYVIPRDRVFQQKLSFSPQEAMLLAIAGRVGAAATGGGALEEALKSALRKLAVDLVGKDPLEDLQAVTVLRAKSGDPRALENVTAISQAVTNNRRIRFTYVSVSSGERTERDVDPYGLGLVRGSWYLVGYCHLRRDMRVFKVARIQERVRSAGTDPAGRDFEVPPGFRLEDHIGREIWDQGCGDPVAVRLEVPAGSSETLLPGGTVVRQGPVTELVEIHVRRTDALVGWVLAQDGRVAVVAPPELRATVRKEAERLLEHYAEPAAGPSPRLEVPAEEGAGR